MKTKDIKIGEMYNVRVKVVKNDFGDTGEIATVTIDENGKEIDGEIAYYTEADAASFSPITHENGTKNTASAPKYDPCRKFRKGDIVEPSEINGRLPQVLRGCYRYEVIVGEGEMTSPLYVAVKPLLEGKYKHLSEIQVNAAFLKLVTPVEELEPYSLDECGFANAVYLRKNGKTYLTIPYGAAACFLQSRTEALAAAEAECARLNAEYRKEQK